MVIQFEAGDDVVAIVSSRTALQSPSVAVLNPSTGEWSSVTKPPRTPWGQAWLVAAWAGGLVTGACLWANTGAENAFLAGILSLVATRVIVGYHLSTKT